jgi:hypothetical protein
MKIDRPVRYRCDLASQLHLDHGEPFSARLLEISESGAFLEEPDAALDLEGGERGVLGIPLPGGEPWVCEVVILRSGTSRRELRHPSVHHLTVLRRGYGLEFASLAEDELERLRGFLELLDSR